MPVPNEIDLLSTRVDSYRQPIDTQTTPFRHPKILVLVPSCQPPKTIKDRSPIDTGRQLSTWVDRFHQVENKDFKGPLADIFSSPSAQIWSTIFGNRKSPLRPPCGNGFWRKPYLDRRPVSPHHLFVNHNQILGCALVNAIRVRLQWH